MLSREDNELLCRVGPDTPMGTYMRRFWTPFLLSRELPGPDCDPLRVRVLGEDLVAFRDSNGRVGLLEEACPHRLASLYYGRNEECGLRCVYHGWKFDVDGNCVDMPSEPEESSFKSKIKQLAYPTEEKGGVIWAYMGPRDKMGQVPSFEWMDVPADHRYQSRWIQDCNYAQSVEGEIDSAHVSFLHSRLTGRSDSDVAITGPIMSGDTAPHWRVVDTDYGMVLGARRSADGARYLWRMNQWLYPYHTMIAPIPGQHITTRAWVPIDDEHHAVICTSYRTDRAFQDEELEPFKQGLQSHRSLAAGTLRPLHGPHDDYGQDRGRQKTDNFSGMPGIRDEDAAMTESPGAISNRTKEHLGTSDTAVIRMRLLLLKGVKDLMRGIEPKAARGGALYGVRSYSTVTEDPTDFDQKDEIMQAMVV